MTFAFALSLHLLLAAFSPLPTAGDYIFTRPATNLIRGVVFGDDGLGLGTMRYEDVAFLAEAVKEREILLRDSISSNEFMLIVESARTNYCVEIDRDTFYPVAYAGRALSSTNAISEDARLWETNAWETEVFGWRTNIYLNATNTIEQVMTNGTVDVWTNFPAAHSSNIVERTGWATNFIPDYSFDCLCLKTGVVLTVDGTPEYLKSRGGTFNGFYSRSTLSNAYALVRATRLSLPRSSSSSSRSPTNATVYGYSIYRDERIDDPARKTSSLDYSATVSYGHYNNDSQTKVDGEWKSEEGYPEDYHDGFGEATVPDSLAIDATLGVDDFVVTYKADTPRINYAYAFAVASLSWERSTSAFCSDPEGSRPVTEGTNKLATVVIPLESKATRSTPKNGLLTFQVTVPTQIFKNAAGIGDVPFLERTYQPNLPPLPGQPKWVISDDGESRTISSNQQAQEIFFCTLGIYLILELNPKTKLSNWIEYE